MSSNRTLAAMIAALCLAGAGCGDDDDSGSGGTTTATESATTQASSTETGQELMRLLLRDGDLQGYKVASAPFGSSDVDEWAAVTRDEAARLRKLGFVAGARADLRNGSGTPGLTLIERFKTAAGARKELAYTPPGPKVAHFEVAGIPGAVGTKPSDPSEPGGRNIAFVKGDTFYIVGTQAARNSASVAELAKAARKQYAAAP